VQSRRPHKAIDPFLVRAGLPVLLIAAVVIALDQVTKTWALGDDLIYPGIHLWGDVRLARTMNHGVAFGLGSGAAPVLIAVAVLCVALVIFKKQLPINNWVIAGMGLVLGGGAGNLVDRVVRDHGGAVIDFIDVGTLPLINREWPVFNVADICVVAGALIIAVFGTRAPVEVTNGNEERDNDGS
jgi:signal peptidase II